jgi:hypothetical protein
MSLEEFAPKLILIQKFVTEIYERDFSIFFRSTSSSQNGGRSRSARIRIWSDPDLCAESRILDVGSKSGGEFEAELYDFFGLT